MNRVAVIVCSYNKKEYLLGCIASVFASDFTGFDLIVVDNASDDGSAEAVLERYDGRLTLLVNGENLGGSGGFHRGMAYAAEKGYDYIHLLDNDVILDADAIGALFRFMEGHPETGACGSLILRTGARGRVQEFGANIDLEHLGIFPIYGGRDAGEITEEFMVCDYVAACSAMFRTSALNRAGIMDPEYFIYCDDIALCWAIRDAGFQIAACAGSVVRHYGSYQSRTAFSRYYFLRNKIYMFTKHLDDGGFLRFREILVSMIFRIFAVNRDNGYIAAYQHGLADGLENRRGKAEPYKIREPRQGNGKLARAFTDKKSILILYDKNGPEPDTILSKIRAVSNAPVTVFTGGLPAAIPEGILYSDTCRRGDYDRVVRLCYHILDEGAYDRSAVYMDRYGNQITDDGDFDFYENLESRRAFFYDIYREFLYGKLDALREKLRRDGGR